jgi:hypothetical protein
MWTKSQKISGAVLALAVGAFVVDRFVLDQPAAAEAPSHASKPAVASRPAVRASKALPTAAPAAETQAITLASRLAAIGESRRFSYEPSGDAFKPSDPWLATVKPLENTATAKATTPDAAPEVKKVDRAAEFQAAHHLNAVMSKQKGGMAIINGKLYVTGQTLSGFKLTSVSDTEATFAGYDTTVSLRLPTSAKLQAGNASADAR